MSNSSTEYEKFVQQIYQQILKEDGYTNINVQHDVLVKGKSGLEHQTDVYWEFSMGGVLYKVCIECKDYKNPVSKGRLMEFSEKISDIGARGIFVTRTGYQSGAKEWARFENIDIFTAREMTDSDWVGRIRRIQVNIAFQNLNVYDVNINVVENLLPDNVDRTQVSGRFGAFTTEVILYDADGARMRDLKEYIERVIQCNPATVEGKKHEETFEPPIWIEGVKGLKLPVGAISFKYKNEVSHRNLVINGDDKIKYQMKNEVTDESVLLDQEKRVVKRRGH
jgi:hypothetical protein